jgi:hypothetical protein
VSEHVPDPAGWNRIATLEADLELLKVENAKLKSDKDKLVDDWVDSENQRIDAVEAVEQMDKMLSQAVELTYREGPAAGMELVDRWLEEYSNFYQLSLRPSLPYDWLSRWLVTDRINA